MSFFLTQDTDKQASSFYLLSELKKIIDNKKYIIIDIALNKTITAVQNSLTYALKGQIVDFRIKKKDYDLSEVEFITKEIGTYRVDFEENNIKINNSPCFINIYDPSKASIKSKPENLIVSANNYINGEPNLNSTLFIQNNSILVY